MELKSENQKHLDVELDLYPPPSLPLILRRHLEHGFGCGARQREAGPGAINGVSLRPAHSKRMGPVVHCIALHTKPPPWGGKYKEEGKKKIVGPGKMKHEKKTKHLR